MCSPREDAYKISLAAFVVRQSQSTTNPSRTLMERSTKIAEISSQYEPSGKYVLKPSCCCVQYGMRSCEIAGLRLEDFDWYNETLTVRRGKRGRVQQFPIQYEVGEAILEYLRSVRPRCSCRHLFVTRYYPHRPVSDDPQADSHQSHDEVRYQVRANGATFAASRMCHTTSQKGIFSQGDCGTSSAIEILDRSASTPNMTHTPFAESPTLA